MVGTTVEAKSPLPVLIYILGLLAVLFLVLGIFTVTPALLLMAIPMALPIPFLFWLRPRAVVMNITENGLQLEHPFQEIPWSQVHGARRRYQKQDPNKACSSRYNLEVLHDHGILVVPHTAHPPVEKLFVGFVETLTPTGSREVPDILQEHLQKWTATFGEDKVYSFKARSRLGNSMDSALMVVAFCLIIGTILAWILAANVPLFNQGKEVNSTFGPITAIIVPIALLFILRSSTRQNAGPHRQFKNWKRSGLVISPMGMVMSQGQLQGEMKWAEVLDVQFQKRLRDGIKIKVAGAEFQVFDLYDRPIFIIYRHIMKYWSNETV